MAEKPAQAAKPAAAPQGPKPAAQRPGAPTVRKTKNVERETKEFRGIIRLVGKDIDGHLEVKDALQIVRGIGQNLAASITQALQKDYNINPKELIGNLPEETLEKIEDIIKNPAKHGVKNYLLNRQIDLFDGQTKHLVGTDLSFMVKQDVGLQKTIRSYIGWRHSLGQPVRGQHNRTTGRVGLTVGVMKKAVKAAAAAAKPAAAAEEKKK